jgi:hypothetical protein
MKPAPECCPRSRGMLSYRGLCFVCETKLHQPRKVHTIESALLVCSDYVVGNPVGAARLAAWALRREAPGGSLRFEQGPTACAALIRR